MKQLLEKLIRQSLGNLRTNGNFEIPSDIAFKIEKTRNPRHGDYATNIALILAGQLQRHPHEIAEQIADHIPDTELVDKWEIAGPGFINFYLKQHAHLAVISKIYVEGKRYGHSSHGKGKSVLIEFVSANPTGPLHIGHGRGAAYGAATANLLEAVGYKVDREYYVNDAGRQMDILAISVYLRYLQLCKIDINFPDNCYQGDYVKKIAGNAFDSKSDSLRIDQGIDAIQVKDDDPEVQLDNIIAFIKSALGFDQYQYFFEIGLNAILADIEQDLQEFGVIFNQWFSERQLLSGNEVINCINQLKEKGFLYEREGATWFRSSTLGDEKDRVVIRENGQLTYFATDIAYHHSKYLRGYNRIIDIWGADHHGYISRIKASLKALGQDPEKLDILLVQFASLYRGKEKVQMSTRSGKFVTLRELRDEVGKDASRFFYVMRKSEQHLDFDLDLAKSQSQDNPVYYIQYAHARICSVFRQLNEKKLQYNPSTDIDDLSMLDQQHELAILNRLALYPEVVLSAAIEYEPHQIGYYLRDLANEFHTYYNACQILVDDNSLRNARLSLVLAVKQVINNGLDLLGVSAPEAM